MKVRHREKEEPVAVQVIRSGNVNISTESEYELWKEVLGKLGIQMNLDLSAKAADLAAHYKIQRR